MSKIVIAGGTGFIGRFLQNKFRAKGFEVLIISRRKGDINWTDKTAIEEALEGADLLINLAGKSVDCRYTDKNKKEILSSRTETTKTLGEAILKLKTPPKLWLNSSTATIYRHAEDRPMTEENGEIGTGFSVEVGKAWEKSLFDFSLPQMRQVALRMAIVLGKNGGVMIPMKRLVSAGLGGKQGNGKQMFSWIHIEDIYRIILFLMEHKEINGVLNLSSPNPVTNEFFMKELRSTMGITIGLPSPAWLLQIGAVIIRTETELILKSRWVLPDRLLKSGFKFSFPEIRPALNDVLN